MRLLAALLCAIGILGVVGLRAPQSLAQAPDLLDLLPSYADVGSDVVLVSEQSRTLAEYASTFSDPDEAIQLLPAWGWEANASCHYESLQLSEGVQPYLFASVTRFRDAAGAEAAMPYLIQDLAAVLGHQEIPAPDGLGDEARQFIAPTEGGTDLSLYVRSGSFVVRVSVLLDEGDPIADPEQIAQLILRRMTEPPTPTPTGMTSGWPYLAPLLDAMPADLPACLRLLEDEHLDYATMSQRFPGVPDAPARLQALGWETAIHRQWKCDPIPATGLYWLDMSVHRFQDAAGAAEAVPFFAHARTVGTQLAPVPAITLGDSTAAIAGPSEHGTEYTLYLSTGWLLFRVSGIAAEGAPQADVESVMTGFLMNVLARKGAAGIPYLTLDPATGRPVAIYPDGTREFIDSSPEQRILTPVPTQPPPQRTCDPSYPDVCILPVEEVGDLDCEDVPYGNFRVIGADPHRLDGPYDGSNPSEPDGFGCEWNE